MAVWSVSDTRQGRIPARLYVCASEFNFRECTTNCEYKLYNVPVVDVDGWMCGWLRCFVFLLLDLEATNAPSWSSFTYVVISILSLSTSVDFLIYLIICRCKSITLHWNRTHLGVREGQRIAKSILPIPSLVWGFDWRWFIRICFKKSFEGGGWFIYFGGGGDKGRPEKSLILYHRVSDANDPDFLDERWKWRTGGDIRRPTNNLLHNTFTNDTKCVLSSIYFRTANAHLLLRRR